MSPPEGGETIVFSGEVTEKGHVKPDRVNETRGRIAKWRGRRVTVTVRRYVKSKSNEQLGFYFGPVIEAWSEFTGYDPDEIHHELKRAYLAPRLVISKLTGEEVKELPSLADLSSEEMSTFLERVLREGRQIGIEFPEWGASASPVKSL